MHDTYLVQRLTRPWRSDRGSAAQPPPVAKRVFLPTTTPGTPEWKEAATLLHWFIAFDFMGAAEYEFGSVRDAIARLVRDSDQVVASQMVLSANEIPPNHRRDSPVYTKRGKPAKKQPVRAPVVDRTVYMLCRQADADEVCERIRKLATRRIRVKMGTLFDLALDPVEEWDSKTVGWLELDNGFFFFLDKDMWTAMTMMLTGKQTE